MVPTMYYKFALFGVLLTSFFPTFNARMNLLGMMSLSPPPLFHPAGAALSHHLHHQAVHNAMHNAALSRSMFPGPLSVSYTLPHTHVSSSTYPPIPGLNRHSSFYTSLVSDSDSDSESDKRRRRRRHGRHHDTGRKHGSAHSKRHHRRPSHHKMDDGGEKRTPDPEGCVQIADIDDLEFPSPIIPEGDYIVKAVNHTTHQCFKDNSQDDYFIMLKTTIDIQSSDGERTIPNLVTTKFYDKMGNEIEEKPKEKTKRRHKRR